MSKISKPIPPTIGADWESHQGLKDNMTREQKHDANSIILNHSAAKEIAQCQEKRLSLIKQIKNKVRRLLFCRHRRLAFACVGAAHLTKEDLMEVPISATCNKCKKTWVTTVYPDHTTLYHQKLGNYIAQSIEKAKEETEPDYVRSYPG